jgi:hypothetical protein
MSVKDTRAVSAPRHVLTAVVLNTEAGMALAKAAVERSEVETATFDFTTGRLRIVSVDEDLLNNVAAVLQNSPARCVASKICALKEDAT